MNPNVKVDEILANIRKSIDSDIETLGGAAPTQQRGTLMRDALRDMRKSMAVENTVKAPPPPPESSDLRSRIRKKLEALEDQTSASHRQSVTVEKPRMAVVPTRKDFSGIMAGPPLRDPAPLRPSYAESDPADDLRYVAPQPQYDWSADPYAYDTGMEESAQYHTENAYAPEGSYEQQAYGAGYEEHLPTPLMSPQTEAHAETAFRQLSDAILSRATGDRSLEEMTREMLKTMLKQWLDANLPTIVEELVREEIQRVARRGR